MSKKFPKCETVAIIGKFDDGKCRQYLVSNGTLNAVLRLVLALEGELKVLETPIEAIDIQTDETSKAKNSNNEVGGIT
jgi:hypothetical protein